jgi:hypothetical protein
MKLVKLAKAGCASITIKVKHNLKQPSVLGEKIQLIWIVSEIQTEND